MPSAPLAPTAAVDAHPAALPLLHPEMDFDLAAEMVLAYLRQNVPLALWSVTRVENDRQTFLYLNKDNGYRLAQGDSHAWEDGFCVHMAAGRTPAVAPDAQSVPLYAAAGVNDTTRIGAYAGAAIYEPTGAVFGAICGMHPTSRVHDDALVRSGSLLPLLGHLLTMVLAADRIRDQAGRSLMEATAAADTDVLTGLPNRRAWERLLAEEEERFLRLADPTVVVVADLDLLKQVNDSQGHSAGDRYLQRAAAALAATLKRSDTVARIGGDEFGVLLRDCTGAQAEKVVARLYDALDDAGVAASLGWSPVTVLTGVTAAIDAADSSMYAAKAARRSQR